jgi:glucose-6-phosphate 1-dehydrogenase
MQERISLLSLGEPNVITLRIQPDDGICLQFGVKPPGLSKVAMLFSYEAAFGKSAANGYERLLLDAMLGDATLFSHRDGVEAACAFHSGP